MMLEKQYDIVDAEKSIHTVKTEARMRALHRSASLVYQQIT